MFRTRFFPLFDPTAEPSAGEIPLNEQMDPLFAGLQRSSAPEAKAPEPPAAPAPAPVTAAPAPAPDLKPLHDRIAALEAQVQSGKASEPAPVAETVDVSAYEAAFLAGLGIDEDSDPKDLAAARKSFHSAMDAAEARMGPKMRAMAEALAETQALLNRIGEVQVEHLASDPDIETRQLAAHLKKTGVELSAADVRAEAEKLAGPDGDWKTKVSRAIGRIEARDEFAKKAAPARQTISPQRSPRQAPPAMVAPPSSLNGSRFAGTQNDYV